MNSVNMAKLERGKKQGFVFLSLYAYNRPDEEYHNETLFLAPRTFRDSTAQVVGGLMKTPNIITQCAIYVQRSEHAE